MWIGENKQMTTYTVIYLSVTNYSILETRETLEAIEQARVYIGDDSPLFGAEIANLRPGEQWSHHATAPGEVWRVVVLRS